MTNQELARAAAVEASSTHAVGDFLEVITENEPNVTTYLFDSKLKGYVGWRWSVSIFQYEDKTTISEVNLIAGEQSVLAPKWVPWSERLADYKALQAALEQQAAEEAAALAEEAAANENSAGTEAADEDSAEDDDFEEVEEIGVDDVDDESASASSDQQSQKPEGDTEDASEEPTSFFRIFRRNKKRK